MLKKEELALLKVRTNLTFSKGKNRSLVQLLQEKTLEIVT